MFVHGLDGLDEISLLGVTRINELKNGQVSTYDIAPEDFGFARCTIEEIKTGTPKENAQVIEDVFAGKITGPHLSAVVLNSAGALVIGDKAPNFTSGVVLAKELIASGAALKKLGELKDASNSF
jgi:anthranilate phosphoribosyltransferase